MTTRRSSSVAPLFLPRFLTFCYYFSFLRVGISFSPLETPSPPPRAAIAKAPPPPRAAFVFCHGLGNSAKTCKPFIQDRLVQLDPSLSDIKFVFPDAPRLCSTINGGKCLKCWFDLYDWPVGLSVRDDKRGILLAVEQIEREIEALVEQGIPRSRIVVGGFSQGATLALETAYRSCDQSPLAGCIALSGWLALRDDLHCSSNACQTPLFWGHGNSDRNVRPEQQFFGVKKLMQQGVRSTTTKSYSMAHDVSTEELYDIADFLNRVFPQSAVGDAGEEESMLVV